MCLSFSLLKANVTSDKFIQKLLLPILIGRIPDLFSMSSCICNKA